MLYKFKSRAAGDVVMLEPHAQALLHIIGKDDRPKGIILPQEMPQALQALKDAAFADKQRAGQAEPAGKEPHPHPNDDATEARITLAQRAWPLIHMMELSIAENREIVWGV